MSSKLQLYFTTLSNFKFIARVTMVDNTWVFYYHVEGSISLSAASKEWVKMIEAYHKKTTSHSIHCNVVILWIVMVTTSGNMVRPVAFQGAWEHEY